MRDSRPRNPRIARVMYLCKMIETWGRGIGVIAGECERCGLPLPRTEKCGGSVVTTFKRPKIADKVENLDQDLDRVDPDLIQIDPDSFTQKLLQTIRRNPLISRKLLTVELNASERKIRESLKNLKDSGFIIRQGPDHGGIWRISRMVKNTENGLGKELGKEFGKKSEVGEKTSEVTIKTGEVIGKPSEVMGKASAGRLSEDIKHEFEVLMGAYRNDFRERAWRIFSTFAENPGIDMGCIAEKLRNVKIASS